MSQDGTWIEYKDAEALNKDLGLSEPSNCQVRARGLDVQCLKDDKSHIFAESAEERLHEGIWRGHQVHWGSTADVVAVRGPIPKTECDS